MNVELLFGTTRCPAVQNYFPFTLCVKHPLNVAPEYAEYIEYCSLWVL